MNRIVIEDNIYLRNYSKKTQEDIFFHQLTDNLLILGLMRDQEYLLIEIDKDLLSEREGDLVLGQETEEMKEDKEQVDQTPKTDTENIVNQDHLPETSIMTEEDKVLPGNKRSPCLR